MKGACIVVEQLRSPCVTLTSHEDIVVCAQAARLLIQLSAIGLVKAMNVVPSV